MRAGRGALILALIVAACAAPRAQEPAPDKSLDRMRAVLANNKPLVVTPLDIQPTFKIEIKAIHPMHDIFDKVPWATDPVGWQPAGYGFDMLSVFRYLQKSAATAQRERDERHARQEVQRAIDDYCAVQPNANRIILCASSPAVR